MSVCVYMRAVTATLSYTMACCSKEYSALWGWGEVHADSEKIMERLYRQVCIVLGLQRNRASASRTQAGIRRGEQQILGSRDGAGHAVPTHCVLMCLGDRSGSLGRGQTGSRRAMPSAASRALEGL